VLGAVEHWDLEVSIRLEKLLKTCLEGRITFNDDNLGRFTDCESFAELISCVLVAFLIVFVHECKSEQDTLACIVDTAEEE